MFGYSVKKGLKKGPVTNKVVNKVIEITMYQVLRFTERPNGEQYSAVCRALVKEYPMLKCSVGNEIVSTCRLVIICAV